MAAHLLTAAAAGMATLLAGYLLLGQQIDPIPPGADIQPCPRLAGLTKTQAEDLLDWLEAQGRTGCTVRLDEAGQFAIQLPEAAPTPAT